MGHSAQSELFKRRGTDLEDLAGVPVRLPEVLAERQQDHMLVVRVQMIRVLRPSKRATSPLEDPLLTTNDANQFMLVRFLPIPRQKAIPSLEPEIRQRSLADSLEGAISCRRFYLFRMSLFKGFYKAAHKKERNRFMDASVQFRSN